MNEFNPEPAIIEPIAPSAPPPAAKKESLLTRPLFLGYSLPWLAGIGLVLGSLAWFLFWPSTASQDASQRAFGQDAGLVAVQPPSAAPAASAPAGLQTGGLSVPATMSTTGNVPDDVVALIREGREFEAANREAIKRLSDTVRAQTNALTALQQQVDAVVKENARLANQLIVKTVQPAAEVTSHTVAGRKGVRSALAGMRLESLQDGMAWVSWQGKTWAVQPGDSLGGVTVRDVNTEERSVTTSAGVLR